MSFSLMLKKCFCCPKQKEKPQWNPINKRRGTSSGSRNQLSTVRFAKVNKVAPLHRSSTDSSWREILHHSSSEISLLSNELDEFVDAYVDKTLRRVSDMLGGHDLSNDDGNVTWTHGCYAVEDENHKKHEFIVPLVIETEAS